MPEGRPQFSAKVEKVPISLVQRKCTEQVLHVDKLRDLKVGYVLKRMTSDQTHALDIKDSHCLHVIL